MKRLIHILIFLAFAFSVKAQVYSNEWINFSNKYYKFPIGKTGYYRIDSLALAASGINVTSLNPNNLQLFLKGQEVPLYIKGESDNVFNGNDFIEFYAEKNNGRFDSTLYYNITYVPNPFISLFNDTIYAFLTWNNLTTNKRIVQETDTATSSYTPAPYFYTEKICTGRNEYNYVEEFYENTSDPRYTQCEGYGYQINEGEVYNTNISPVNIYTQTALPVNVEIAFSGSNNDISILTPYDHEIKGVVYDVNNTPVKLFDTVFRGYKPFKYSFSLQSNTLSPSSNIELSSLTTLFPSVDNRISMHYIYVKYPQLPYVAGTPEYKLFVDDDPVFSKTYLRIGSVATGTNGVILFYDLTNNKRIPVTIFVDAKLLVPHSGSQKVCYMAAESSVINITKLKPVNQSGFFVNHKTSDDSAFVIITPDKFVSEATAYKTHRQSISGGSHDVILATIEDLTDQFAYGIQKHPLAIRNFCTFLMDSLPTPPRYVFLIGKSIEHRNLTAGADAWTKSMIPSMGIPPSDNLLTASLKTTNYFTPDIPIGHLAAQTNSEVTEYLAKVIQHETPVTGAFPTDDWKKHVLHFAGGTDAPQQNLFESFLNSYKNVIQDTAYGGKVYDFKKTTTAPIQITISDSVKNHFNYGVGLVTFFGHGSYTGFDQAIDDPNAYNNAGKYPFFIANSCYSGNIHTYDVISNSEKFVLAKQKGSIAFLAASSLGFVNTLHLYTQNIYNGLSYYNYNKSIGEIVKSTCLNLSSSFPAQMQHFTAADMTLHGDPSLKISGGALPDYYIDNSRVFFDTKSHVDSLGIFVDISNFGRAVKDSFIVRIERYFPTGDSVTIFKRINAPYNRDTLAFYTPIDFTRGFGLNKFRVMVDAYSGITESNETNNSTSGTVNLFIQGGDLVPVYPYKYAVIPSTSTITLKASTSDPFAATRNYRMQLDTTDSFISPLTTTIISSSGGVVEWTVNLPFADSTVYYWRVSKDSINAQETFVWRESSFQTITNKHGWGQSHFFQFKNDGYQFVKYKKPIRRFVFENDKASLFCSTRRITNSTDFANIIYSVNGSVKHTWNCEWNGWTVAVFDSISGKPWQSNTGMLSAQTGTAGNFLCAWLPQALYAYDFGADTYDGSNGNVHPAWKTDLENFLNFVPVNNMVLAYSAQNHTSSTFNNSLYTAFESIGSASIRTVPDDRQMIIFGRKGSNIGDANEAISTNSIGPVSLNDTIKTKWNNGFIASELIGPGYKWNSFHWKVRSLDATAGDTTVVKIVGYKPNGDIDTLVTFTQDSLNVLALYNYADAKVYPYLRLVAFKKDNIHRTAPQLKHWYVLYDEAPECAINPKKGFVAINDTLQEGDNVTIVLPIENVGTIPFTDSLVVTYWIEDANRVNNYLPQKMKAKPFAPGAVILDSIKINTYQFPGNNALWVDVNPPQNSKYQKEQYHFNNIARYPFSVSRDITNPLLDVTFDGVRIMNGDVVSAKPHILINLKDENKFLALNDTSAFSVFIKKPSDLTEKRIYFASGLIFTPAQLPGNSCKIEYNANLPEDGKHILIVQATDRSDNQSGAVDYRITFEVINKSTITRVVNYPNPFSTSTRFVFDLTGSEVPEMFNIQIMTITGKVVKTIMRDELGPMHVGRNITEYAWDGKDDFGDKLGNGVYLYKVQTKINGQSIEHKSTDADGFFTKELGKMVIMR